MVVIKFKDGRRMTFEGGALIVHAPKDSKVWLAGTADGNEGEYGFSLEEIEAITFNSEEGE